MQTHGVFHSEHLVMQTPQNRENQNVEICAEWLRSGVACWNGNTDS